MSNNNIRPFTYEETKLLMDMMRGVEIKPYSPGNACEKYRSNNGECEGLTQFEIDNPSKTISPSCFTRERRKI